MCGIVALINLDGKPVDRSFVEQMTEAMGYRGPDAHGAWVHEAVGIGHTRLATTGDDPPPQPCTLDGRVWITADVRLDGRADLIASLRAHGGTVPESASDVELLLHAYHRWQEACLQRLLGDFAFVLWDDARRRLLCARDHFGVTPLYYARQDDCLLLSNTLNVLHTHPGVSDTLNDRALADYLTVGNILEPATTAFAAIRRVPGAHTLTWSREDGLTVEPYYNRPDVQPLRYKKPQEYIDHFRTLFQTAVADRLRGDRAAIAMSGGLDSTAVAATAAALRQSGHAPAALQAFAIGFDWLMPDEERYYASLVAAHSRLPTHYLSAETYLVQDDMDRAWFLPPEPRLSLRPVPVGEIIQREAANRGRTVLTGLGGDLLLAPTPSYWIDQVRHGRLGRIWSDARLHRQLTGRRPPLYLRAGVRRWAYRRAVARRAQDAAFLPVPSWLNRDFTRRVDLPARCREIEALYALDDERAQMMTPYWANALSAGDPDFTSAPVKVRHPFFDVRLFEFAHAVPAVPWLVNKNLLRHAMQGILPDPVRLRPKTPLHSDFFHAVAVRQPAPWTEELAMTPALAEYVDLTQLLEAVRAPEKIPAGMYFSRVLLPLSLAYWLRNRHRLTAKCASTAQAADHALP